MSDASRVTKPKIAVVAIGRNEGQRLVRCLASIGVCAGPIVYVDSGSGDGSADRARLAGAHVVELDGDAPFTAGRARNAGFDEVLAMEPSADLVQFVDGDCELAPGWMERGARSLAEEPEVAMVCGRVRERQRERTVYNRLCDLEWDGPVGSVSSCGGNAMVRVRAFREVGGFVPTLIAGEEPELCLRMRRRGWRILRVAEDMVLHDASMAHFGQWWRRALRSGWAYAEAAALHGAAAERYGVRESGSILFWGTLLPAAMLVLAAPTAGLSLALGWAYVALGARIYGRAVRRGVARRDALLQAFFTVLGKFPQAIGQVQFAFLRLVGKRRAVVDWRTTG